LDKKKTLEEEGVKLLNEVERLENELEITILEEKYLIEESFQMLKRVETSLELDENIDHIIFSSQAINESAETELVGEHSDNGQIIAIGT
jgi:hypothetical protein